MGKIPVAVQMYTLREAADQDFAGTLKKVADLGFHGVEFAGFGDLKATEVKVLLDEYGLQAASSHIPLEELEKDLDKVIKDQKIIGSNYIVVPFLMPDRRKEEDYQALISFLNKAGEVCKQEGITLCYHNHDFELDKLSDGRTALDTIFESTDAKVVETELDIYWITKAGDRPQDWLRRYKNRTPLVHLKDMTTDENKFFAELGTGGVELESVLEMGEEIGVKWWIVEQDVCQRDPFESIEVSLNYLRDLKVL